MGTAQGAGAIRVVIPPDPGQVLAATPQGHYGAAGLWQPASNGPHLAAKGGAIPDAITRLNPVLACHQATPRAARAIATPSG